MFRSFPQHSTCNRRYCGVIEFSLHIRENSEAETIAESVVSKNEPQIPQTLFSFSATPFEFTFAADLLIFFTKHCEFIPIPLKYHNCNNENRFSSLLSHGILTALIHVAE